MSCVAGRNVRTVPTSVACAGMTLMAPGIARLHRAEAHHRGIDRAHVARDDRLHRRDDVAGDEHGIDRRVRMGAVPAAAVDLDFDAVRRGHRGPGRDADPSGRQAGPVVQREHLLRRKTLEETVLDHRLGPGIAFFAGLEDEVRGAVEVARLVRDSAPPRAASSCGRRGRSRASGRRSATCARTRSPPASAARPCRRAGRPRGRSRRTGRAPPRRLPVLPMPE